MNIGQTIRDSREANDLGLRQLAMSLSITPSYLSKVERNLEQPGELMLEAIGERLRWSRAQIDEAILATDKAPARIVQLLQEQPRLIDLLVQELKPT